MKKPLILIYGNVYDTTVGQGQAYMTFFSQFGDVIIVTSEMDLDRMIKLGDVLAVPGGMDLNPDRYGSKPGFDVKHLNAHYEYLDKHLLDPWIDTYKPIIGICRGMQALNVACGGTLQRHIRDHVQDDNKYWRHDTPQFMYTEIKGKNDKYYNSIFEINSLHHQCVNVVAPGFDVLGWSEYSPTDPAKKRGEFKNCKFTRSKDGIIVKHHVQPMVPEIIRHKEHPFVAFQYHPEEFNCELAIALIEETLLKYENQKAAKKEGAATN